MNDTPYHVTYGQHPRVGISNLPVSAAILQNLSTKAELQDLYSTMNVDGVALPAPLSTTDGSYRKDLPPDDAGLDNVMLEIAIATADKLVPQTPLGKHKERSAQLPSHLSRELCDAKRQEMTMVVLHDHAKEKDIASPSEGKNRDEREVPSTRWLEMMDNRDRLELEERAHARVNSVFPIIYCTNNKDINDIANWAPCILRKVRKEQYEVLDQHEQDRLKKTSPGEAIMVYQLHGACTTSIPPRNFLMHIWKISKML